MDEGKKKLSFFEQVYSLKPNFWYACFMEIIERLAFFGVRAIAPLYLIASTSKNGLGLDYKEKSLIYTVWALLQCLVPMVSGGYTDRYGYKKSLAVSFVLNILGYLGMAQSRDLAEYLKTQGWESPGFWIFMVSACFVAVGTAIFKPPAQGTIAKTTDEETSSMGWGIFYWVVNIGGALAPMGAATLRGEIDWDIVFYGAAFVTVLNFLPAFLLFKEPEKDLSVQPKGPIDVFVSCITTIMKDIRLVVFLGIFSCFWLMFMQLWDLLPNFIDEWIDSTDVAPWFGWFSDSWILGDGRVKPEMIINIDSIAIIILVIPLSILVGKINKVAAMIVGMVISLVGFVVAGSTMVGWICCLAVFVFAIGEMACSPTFSAYVGLIAPKDKKALYIGYSNIPFAIGWALGNLIGGFVYDECGSKDNLALQHLSVNTALVSYAAQSADWSDSLEKIPALLKIDRDDAFSEAKKSLKMDDNAAAAALLRMFKHDEGQLNNLALMYLAMEAKEEKKKEVMEKLAKVVSELDDSDELDDLAKEKKALVESGESLDQICHRVHLMPSVLGQSKADAFNDLRKLLDKDSDKETYRSRINELLWERYSNDSDVLNNLALEYLAQATDRVKEAIENQNLKGEVDNKEESMKSVTEKTNINRSKAFLALSVAMGADQTKVDQVLTDPAYGDETIENKLSLYLINQPKTRYEAVSAYEWNKDLGFLRDLVTSDMDALNCVKTEIDKEGMFSRIVAVIKGWFTDSGKSDVIWDGVNYTKLARNKDLIQKALSLKKWNQSGDQASCILGLNPNEAKALIKSDTKKTTDVLWDFYGPYSVWFYLGGIGLIGTIGMIIFYFASKKHMKKAKEE